MRAVSFVDRIELDFSKNLLNDALALGDVDNDGGNELAVGNIEGSLSIFKGKKSSPWKKCSDLGMITCVKVGDIRNCGKNSLVCLTAKGWCYIFDVEVESSESSFESEENPRSFLKPTFTEYLPANSKLMLLADVDSDGRIEVAVGYSDRTVRLFRWRETDTVDDSAGRLEQIGKWQLNGQIGSITVNMSVDNQPELLVAQPGGTYARLYLQPNTNLTSNPHERIKDVIYQSLGTSQTGNMNVYTEMLGGICPSKFGEVSKGTYFALSTLNGSLMLFDQNKPQWSLQVDHQLFSLSKLDVTGDGTEEVVCCSWDGQTYIVNHDREAVRFQFEENVAAFAAGFYAINPQSNVPCFVYATFNRHIYLYHNIRLPQVAATDLIEVMAKQPETKEILKKLSIDPSSTSQLQQVYHYCLYGFNKN
ncbi:complex ITFG2-like isoform X1 [Octopus vulgaris]|uniref:Complex ITFG2-like isoform X1 n=2 Tax=Octopus TaxID=6643 RepID=A0AA36BRW3_OCTVU|nr:KICSTOR complex protein ITFG2 [Octopus sinensis]CAI9739426.1 complex ITFG2-like isoform X1 [Octopus vulgaris]